MARVLSARSLRVVRWLDAISIVQELLALLAAGVRPGIDWVAHPAHVEVFG